MDRLFDLMAGWHVAAQAIFALLAMLLAFVAYIATCNVLGKVAIAILGKRQCPLADEFDAADEDED